MISNKLFLLGCKGATGTQDSYLKLFSKEKVLIMNQMFAEKVGHKVIYLSGQTYTHNMDNSILNVLSNFASTMHYIANNLRLWQSKKELYELFDQELYSSNAMPYKQNPMRCERICSLARKVMNNKNIDNFAFQW